MAGIKPTYASVEYLDAGGAPVVVEDVRVLFADRLAYERTAKARRWDVETLPMTGAGYLAWAALKRTGQYTGSYDDFLAQVVDVQLDDAKAEDDTSQDPTRPAR